MSEFRVGQLVRVTHPANTVDRKGKITFKALALRDITRTGEPLEYEYLVAFDDTGHQETVSESWLEAI